MQAYKVCYVVSENAAFYARCEQLQQLHCMLYCMLYIFMFCTKYFQMVLLLTSLFHQLG